MSTYDLTPAEAARTLGVGRTLVLAYIHAGELRAWDARRPGSRLPRWRISPADIEEFKQSRRAIPQTNAPPNHILQMPRFVGVLSKRIAAIQAKEAREQSQASSTTAKKQTSPGRRSRG